ncbi:MAG: hypothetical protein EBZ53_04850, partial [Verrucomicrobia bacterium]|nr:hypothetical protein [Verrucomicrobiota bacterium]
MTASRAAAREITREHARTFYFASHVLGPSVQRDAYAVYACCRSIDDAVDRAAARGEKVRPEVAGAWSAGCRALPCTQFSSKKPLAPFSTPWVSSSFRRSSASAPETAAGFAPA